MLYLEDETCDSIQGKHQKKLSVAKLFISLAVQQYRAKHLPDMLTCVRRRLLLKRSINECYIPILVKGHSFVQLSFTIFSVVPGNGISIDSQKGCFSTATMYIIIHLKFANTTATELCCCDKVVNCQLQIGVK